MMTAEVLRELREAGGDPEEHAPVEIDGAAIAATLRPTDGEALARTIQALGRLGLRAVVRGAGSDLGLGNPPRDAAVFLSVERLSGVDEFDEGEGVCHVRAGTRLDALREKLAASAWELPLDAPGAGTVGGCLAAARIGPRCLGHGLPRDVVLGLEVVLGSGERTHCGGRVVKNVTGYDLNKLYTGSLGSLGVIEGAWLRLRPRPEASRVLEIDSTDLTELCATGLAAARGACARAVAGVAEAGSQRLVVELAGDAPVVERDARWLETEHGARAAGTEARDRIAATLTGVPEPGGLRLRISARVSRLAAAAAALRGAAAYLVIQPGLGLLYVGFAAEAGPGAWKAGRGTARSAGGAAVLEAAPLAVKQGSDVFAGDPALLPIVRALKQGFDPQGVLNAGRFTGCI